MTGPITFSGLGSGLDIDAIVTGLVGASSQPLRNANARASEAQAAISTLSGVGSLLGDLRAVVDSLDTATELASYSGKSGNEDALEMTTTGNASPASYTVSDVVLAKEQRTYSATFADKGAELSQAGTLTLSQGGTDYDVEVEATDSLADIGAKINELDSDMSASLFFDGTDYRLQIRSKETGDEQAFVVSEGAGIDLGLDEAGATVQAASDASLTLDGFVVTSANNTIADALNGVTLTLKEETSEAFSISVGADSESMKTSLEEFVDKYNEVIERIHSVAGFGDSEGSSSALAGDSALRGITNRLSSQILSSAGTGGNLNTLADLGIRLNNNGTLKVDADQMEEALVENPDNFAQVLAGDDTNDGLMDVMGDLIRSFTDIGSGSLDIRKEGLRSEIKLFEASSEREQRRLDQMELRLRKTFSAMDAQMGQTNVQMAFLAGI